MHFEPRHLGQGLVIRGPPAAQRHPPLPHDKGRVRWDAFQGSLGGNTGAWSSSAAAGNGAGFRGPGPHPEAIPMPSRYRRTMRKPTIASATTTTNKRSSRPITSPRRERAGGTTTNAETDCWAGQEVFPCPVGGPEGGV